MGRAALVLLVVVGMAAVAVAETGFARRGLFQFDTQPEVTIEARNHGLECMNGYIPICVGDKTCGRPIALFCGPRNGKPDGFNCHRDFMPMCVGTSKNTAGCGPMREKRCKNNGKPKGGGDD